jgi:XTP/dITP diphosphohydrolase
MSIQLIFATGNPNKVKEIQSMLDERIRIITMKEAGYDIDIPEPYLTLEENAREKSKTIHKLSGVNTFGEDTGLEVAALGGQPGVFSARYAGDQKSARDNIEKLLQNLNSEKDRSAQFRTVISLFWDGREFVFEGACNGHIADAPQGNEGFGYDPVFIPENSDKTFAEMSLEEKNQYSHRAKAMIKLTTFLHLILPFVDKK